MQVPVTVIVDSKKQVRIEVGSPPTSALLKKELGIDKGSGKPNVHKAADMPVQIAVKIAQSKLDSMLSYDVKAATKEVIGSCVPLGVLVDGMSPQDAQKAIDAGKYDALFEDGANLDYDRAAFEARRDELQSTLSEEKAAETAAKEAEADEAKEAEATAAEEKKKEDEKEAAKPAFVKKQ